VASAAGGPLLRTAWLAVAAGWFGFGAAVAYAEDPPPAPPPPAPQTEEAPPPPPPPPTAEDPPPPPPAPAPSPLPVPAPVPVPNPPAVPGAKPAPPPAPAAKKPSDCPPWICRDSDPLGNDRATGVVNPDTTDKSDTSRTAKKPAKKSGRFIEGELANVGAIGLVPWENRFGTVVGIERIGDIFYAGLTPQINYSREVADRPLTMSFGLPLRFELHDTRPEFVDDDGTARGRWQNAGAFRTQDWDEPSDFAQLIRAIQYGGKEGHLYLDINAFKASSIGHGSLLKRYNPNLNLNSRQVSAQLDAFGDYGGAETFVNDITGPSILGALVFVKPLSLIDRSNYVLRSFSVGATVIADVDAPLRNRLDIDDVDNDGRRANEFRINQKSFQPEYIDNAVVGFGIDAEVKVLDTRTTDWKTYVDYSTLSSGLPQDDPEHPIWDKAKLPRKYVQSGGLSWGNLVRVNLGQDTVHALRMRTEVRRYDQNYLPSYFDVMYEIQRVQYDIGARGRPDPNGTKLQQILGRKGKDGKVFGLYFEASWLVGDLFAMAVAMEVNDTTPDNNFFLHLELPKVRNFQALATLHRRSAKEAGDLFAFSGGERDILILKGRYRVADSFHINLEALTPYGIGPDSYFANTLDFNLNAEFGFGYGDTAARKAKREQGEAK